ncbi:MAG: hypothetical protein MI923_02360 [Phycisphaerales bacterium]|nr:hypothetical protein [Phycisphaerales bacterium]
MKLRGRSSFQGEARKPVVGSRDQSVKSRGPCDVAPVTAWLRVGVGHR